VYLLIALLCSIAGAVDCVAYFRLGHLFVANLTGNTVLFAYSAAQQHWAAAAQRLGLILAFFLGVVTNRTMQRWIQAGNKTLNPAVVSLAIECSLLCVLAFFSSDGDLRIVLLLFLAWTMGLQNDAFQNIGPVNLNTAFLTGDIEKLGSILASPVKDAELKRKRRVQIGAFLTAWISYALGAIVGAFGGRSLPGARALLMPATMSTIVLLLEMDRPLIFLQNLFSKRR
jgi:uncharacterized membrane protein YoaK (UPF0700 family)